MTKPLPERVKAILAEAKRAAQTDPAYLIDLIQTHSARKTRS